MASKRKYRTVTTTIANAVSYGCGELSSLAEELREIVDNASGTNRENMPRIQALGEAADTLEGIEEPTVEENVGLIAIEYTEQLPRSAKRGLSRADRRDNGVNAIDACLQLLVEVEGDEHQTLIEDLEFIKDSAEGVEFPGMFG